VSVDTASLNSDSVWMVSGISALVLSSSSNAFAQSSNQSCLKEKAVLVDCEGAYEIVTKRG